MVSFTDHYNAVFIDRFPSKTKIRKDSWYFKNSLLCKSEFSLTTKSFIIILKNAKYNYSSVSDWWKNTKSSFKKMLEPFPGVGEKTLRFQY